MKANTVCNASSGMSNLLRRNPQLVSPEREQALRSETCRETHAARPAARPVNLTRLVDHWSK
jgi:hypothetical protein